MARNGTGIKLEGEATDRDRRMLEDAYSEQWKIRRQFKEMSAPEREAVLVGMKQALNMLSIRSSYRRVYRRISDQCYCSHDINSEYASLSYMHKKLLERENDGQ